LRNIVRIVTETGLRINKELLSMRKDQVDIANATVWIPDSEDGEWRGGPGEWLFPSHRTAGQHYKSAKGIWRAALRKAGVSYFRIYDTGTHCRDLVRRDARLPPPPKKQARPNR
jgi:integrase